MLRISLVDLPAVESDFQKFGKPVRVVMESDEQRLILGCVMRADFPIYRVDARGEYYVFYSKSTIRTMAEKYLEENRQNRVNLMHCGEEVRGVQMVQLFIKDTAKGISPAGFEDIEDGSLFAEFHVEDSEIWAWIKEGFLRGFSLEGFFDMQETNQEINMKKKIKEFLAKVLTKNAAITTDKGVLTYDGELEIGKDVYLLHEDGEITDVPDGEYLAEDGRTIVVSDSEVSEIREKEDMKKKSSCEDVEGEPEGEIKDDVDIHNLAAEVERLKEEIARKDEAIKALEDRMDKLEGKADKTEEAMRKMNAAKTAHEEIKGEEKTDRKFKNEHEKFLYELNKAR